MKGSDKGKSMVAAPGELYSTAQDTPVASTEQIYDYLKEKSQETINTEVQQKLNELEANQGGNDGLSEQQVQNKIDTSLQSLNTENSGTLGTAVAKLISTVGNKPNNKNDHETRITALESTSPTDYSERLNTIETNISDLGTGLSNANTSIQAEETRAKGAETRLEGLINNLDEDIEDLNNGLNNINSNILLQFKEKRTGTISDTSRFHAETTGCNPTAVFYYEQYKRFMVERNGQIFGYWGCGNAYNDYSPNGEDATPFKNRIYVDQNKLVYTWDGVTLRALGLQFENSSNDSGSQEDEEETPTTIPEVAYGDLNIATVYSYYTVTETTNGVKYKVGTLQVVNSPEGIIQILTTPKNLEEGTYEPGKVHTYTRAKIGSNWSEWQEKTGITTDEVYDETIAHSQQWINQIIGRVIDFQTPANGLKDNTVKSSTIGSGEVNSFNLSQGVINAINSYQTAINNLRTELQEKDQQYATTITNLSNRIIELEQKENTLIDTNVAGFFIVDSEDNIGASFTSNYKGIGFDPKENYLVPYLKDNTWYLYNKPISKDVIPDGISDVSELIDGEEYIQSYGQQEMGSYLDSWEADDGKWIFYPYIEVSQQTYSDNNLDGPLTIDNVTYSTDTVTVTVVDKIETEGTYYLEIAVPTNINYYEDITPLEYTSGSGKKLIIPGADFSDLGYGKLSELEVNNKFVLTIPTNTNSEYSSITITDANDEEQELYQCFFNGTTYVGRLLQVHVDVNSSYQVDDSFYSNLQWDVIASSNSVMIADTNPDYPEYKTFVFSPQLGEQEITIKCTDSSTNYSYKKTIKVKYAEPSFEIVLNAPEKYAEGGTFILQQNSYNDYTVTKSSDLYKIRVNFSRKILLDQIEVTSITWSSDQSYQVPNVSLTDFNKSCQYDFSRPNNVDNEVLTYTVNYRDKLSNASSKSISRQITVSVINDYSGTASTTPAPNAAPSVVLRNKLIREKVTVLEPVYYGTDTLADMEIESKNDSAIVENNVLTVVDSNAPSFQLRGVMKNNETQEYEFELPNFTSHLVSIRIDSSLTAVMTAKKVQLGVLGTLENGETYYDDIPVYWSVTSDSDQEIASINEDGLLTINEGMSGHIVVKARYKGDPNIYDIKGSTVYYLETPPVSMKYNNNTPKSDIQCYTRTPMSSDSERVLDYYIDQLSIHAYEGGSVNENDATEPNYIQCFVTIGATGKYKGDNGVTYSQPRWFEDSGNTRVSGRECIPLLETDSNRIECLEDYSETLPSNKIVTLITKDGNLYDEYWMKYRVNDQVSWRVVSYGKAPRNSDANSSNNSNGFIPVDGGITINGSTVITTNTTTSAPSTTPAPGPNHIIGLVGNLSGPRFSTTEKGKLLIPNLDPNESDVIYEITVEATLKNRKGETITETETFSYSYQSGTQSVIDDNLEIINTIDDPQNYNMIYYYLVRGNYYNSLSEAKDNYQFRYDRSADQYLDDFKSKYIRVKKKVGVGYLVWPWDEPDEIWYPIRIGSGYTDLGYFFKLSGNPAKRANDLYDPNYEYNYVSAISRESKYESNLGWYFPKKSTDYMHATNWSFCAKPDGQLHKNEVRVYYILMPGGYAISKCYPTWDRILYSTRSIKNSPQSIQVQLNDKLPKIPGTNDYYFDPDPNGNSGYLQGRDLDFGIKNIIKSVTPYPIKQSNDPDPYDGAPIYCVVGTAIIDGNEVNCDYGWTTDENGNRIQQSIIYNDSKTKIIGGYQAYCVCTGNGYSFKVYGTGNQYKMVLLKVTWGTAETYVKFYVKYAPSRIDKF